MLLGKDEAKLQRYTQAQIFMDRIALAHKVKPGDKLTVWTLKCSTTEACNNRTEVHRKAKVIAVYPHFVHTRLLSPYPGRTGCEESFRWDNHRRRMETWIYQSQHGWKTVVYQQQRRKTICIRGIS